MRTWDNKAKNNCDLGFATENRKKIDPRNNGKFLGKVVRIWEIKKQKSKY